MNVYNTIGRKLSCTKGITSMCREVQNIGSNQIELNLYAL